MPPGGDELNVAVALSLLGVKSKWVSDSVADKFHLCFNLKLKHAKAA